MAERPTHTHNCEIFKNGPISEGCTCGAIAALVPPEERARRTRLAWWARLTDEQRKELIDSVCTGCGSLNRRCSGCRDIERD